MTIKESLEIAKKEKVDSMEAKILLKHILKKDRLADLEFEITNEEFQSFVKNLSDLKEGRPLQYITNRQSFYGEDFWVNESVLIPQPDTEVLVEKTIEIIEKINNATLSNFNETFNNSQSTLSNFKSSILSNKLKILDLCTGSGAIAISIKKNTTNTEVYASDISSLALEVARKNAKAILNNKQDTIKKIKDIKTNNEKEKNKEILTNAEGEIKFIQSDMFENINQQFDIIVSNPPYIKTTEIKLLAKDVQNEPILALDGGEDGLKFYRIIKKNIDKYLKDNGYLLMEIGYDQKEDVINLFENSYCIKDYAGNNRVVVYQMRTFIP